MPHVIIAPQESSGEPRREARRNEDKMGYEGQSIMSAVIFALIWTAGMLWWFSPDHGVVQPALLVIGGVLIGVICRWVHGRLWRKIE